MLAGRYELSTHAIKITFPDEEFTADSSLAEAAAGPEDPPLPERRTTTLDRTDPETHKIQVLARNTQFGPGRAIFSREIRILKWLNQCWRCRTG